MRISEEKVQKITYLIQKEFCKYDKPFCRESKVNTITRMLDILEIPYIFKYENINDTKPYGIEISNHFIGL